MVKHLRTLNISICAKVSIRATILKVYHAISVHNLNPIDSNLGSFTHAVFPYSCLKYQTKANVVLHQMQKN